MTIIIFLIYGGILAVLVLAWMWCAIVVMGGIAFLVEWLRNGQKEKTTANRTRVPMK